MIQLNLKPFGNSKPDGHGNFTCENGPEECKFNSYTGCAIYFRDYLAEGYFKFITCLLENPTDKRVPICANITAPGTDYW